MFSPLSPGACNTPKAFSGVKKGMVFGLLLLAGLGFSACEEFESLDVTGPESLNAGETAQLTATYTSDSTGSQDVTDSAFWFTHDSTVAQVNTNTGLVTAIGAGETDIEVHYNNQQARHHMIVFGGGGGTYTDEGAWDTPIYIGSGSADYLGQVGATYSYYSAQINKGWTDVYANNPTADIGMDLFGNPDFINNFIGSSDNPGTNYENLLLSCEPGPCNLYIRIDGTNSGGGAGYNVGVLYSRDFAPEGNTASPVQTPDFPFNNFLAEVGPSGVAPSFYHMHADAPPDPMNIRVYNFGMDLRLEVFKQPDFVGGLVADVNTGTNGAPELANFSPGCAANCDFYIRVTPVGAGNPSGTFLLETFP